MANPFPFTAGQVLTAAQMNGIGETTAFTPTWTNLTVGNGTQDFEYTRVQNLVYVAGKLTFGSTTSVSGTITINFPIAADTTTNVLIIGDAALQDTGVGTYQGSIYQLSTNAFGIYINATNGTYLGALTAVNATVPFTWTNTDILGISFVYKVA